MLFPSVSIPIRSHCKHNNGGEKRGLSPTLAMNILWSSQPLPHIKPQSVQAADCGFYPMWVFFSVQELPVLSLSSRLVLIPCHISFGRSSSSPTKTQVFAPLRLFLQPVWQSWFQCRVALPLQPLWVRFHLCCAASNRRESSAGEELMRSVENKTKTGENWKKISGKTAPASLH